MNNMSRLNDNMIRENTNVPYTSKDKKHALEENNTIVVSHKKKWLEKIKLFFKRK